MVYEPVVNVLCVYLATPLLSHSVIMPAAPVIVSA